MKDGDAMVHLIDDDPSVAAALRRLLRAEGYDCTTHDSAESFLAGFDHSRPACILVDIDLPGMDGFEVQSRLAALNAHCPVIFVTGTGSIPSTVRAMKAGAVDFLTKPVGADTLLGAVGEALANYRHCSLETAERDEIGRAIETLTPREREVLGGIETGLMNKQIAAELGIAEKTVKVHRGRMMKKLGARTLADLFRKVSLLRS